MKDIRLYYYKSGQLHKVPMNKEHRFDSIEAAEGHITISRNMRQKWISGFWRDNQFVIVEYTGKYQSHIVKTIPKHV